MADLGSGISLDSTLDLVIDETGDIGYEQGTSELEKDLAFRMIRNLDRIRGFRNQPEYMKDVEILAARIARADDRVDDVVSVSARPVESDEMEIVMELQVGDETLEAVIQI